MLSSVAGFLACDGYHVLHSDEAGIRKWGAGAWWTARATGQSTCIFMCARSSSAFRVTNPIVLQLSEDRRTISNSVRVRSSDPGGHTIPELATSVTATNLPIIWVFLYHHSLVDEQWILRLNLLLSAVPSYSHPQRHPSSFERLDCAAMVRHRYEPYRHYYSSTIIISLI